MDTATKAFCACTLLTLGFSFAFVGKGSLLSKKETLIPLQEAVSTKKITSNPVVVLELFTSQGCSSCPAADILLEAELKKQNSNTIALAYHVDYWNYLGWEDPFSKPEFAERQRAYASRFKSRRVYTPQLVVDGKSEFVGSDAAKFARAIESARQGTSSQVAISFSDKAIEDGKLIISYEAVGLPKGAELHFALIRNRATTIIEAGENEGLKLVNTNIVIHLQTRKEAIGKETFLLPSNVLPSELSLVAFAQEPHLGPIVGGTILHL